MESKHTPGPWAIDHELPPNARSVIARVDGIAISGNTVGPHIVDNAWANADAARYGMTLHPTSIANARLIAAAPELLAALKSLVQQIEWDETSFLNEDADEGNENDLTIARAAIAKATQP